MKRLALVFFALGLVVSTGFPGQDVTVLKVKVQSANVRSEPDMTAAVVKQVRLGMLLESRQKIGEWYEVTITDDRGTSMSGFINASVVDVLSGGARGGGQTVPQPVQPPQYAPPVYAQPRPEPAAAAPSGGGAGIKLMGGLGLANMSFTFPAGTDPAAVTAFNKYKQSKMGYAGGIGFSLGRRFGLEFDVLYLQKGIRFKGTDTSTGDTVDFDVTATFNMISVPVLLRLNVVDVPNGPSIYVMGGGEIAYLLNGKSDSTITQGGETKTDSQEIKKENLNSIDYGIVAGAGVGLNLGSVRLFVEGRYHLGMANLEKSTTGTEAPEADYKPTTTLILFLAGLKF